MGGVTLHHRRVARQRKSLQMSENDAQVRYLVGEADGGFSQIESRVCHFEREPGLRESLHVFDKSRALHGGNHVVAFPHIAVADPRNNLLR